MLITAGPTHEPIDAVRYLGNRSSGRLGIALARAAADAGWRTTLLLGPTGAGPPDTPVETRRFRTAAELQGLLSEEFPACDVLVMAAAVADYRPRHDAGSDAKIRRTESALTLELEPTPDLLADCAARRRAGQTLVGFALEPRERLVASARDKLLRKGVDAIVANPLETMDALTIDATLVQRDAADESTGGPVPKERFAVWLLKRVETLDRRNRTSALDGRSSHKA